MAEAKSTTNHETIKHWIEEHDGRPSRVKGTASTNDPEGGILRVDFGEPQENLEQISWDEFFRVFDSRDLAFLYQEDTGQHEKSYFNKFVRRSSAHA